MKNWAFTLTVSHSFYAFVFCYIVSDFVWCSSAPQTRSAMQECGLVLQCVSFTSAADRQLPRTLAYKL